MEAAYARLLPLPREEIAHVNVVTSTFSCCLLVLPTCAVVPSAQVTTAGCGPGADLGEVNRLEEASPPGHVHLDLPSAVLLS
jgi:hypothetical protein